MGGSRIGWTTLKGNYWMICISSLSSLLATETKFVRRVQELVKNINYD